MKRTTIFSGAVILLFLFILAACDEQNNRTDAEDMTEIKEELREVTQTIDEALATDDISEFKNKTDDAISSVDNKIDDYLDEMDKADRRIDGNTRNQVIDIKQKKVEVEFKLALLEQDDYDWDDDHYDNYQQTGVTTDTRTDGAGDDQVRDDRRTTTGQMDRTRTYTNRREIKYGPELVEDIKSDLMDLRRRVDQLAQTLPISYDENRSGMR